ncbi:TonB-dependent receptor domain-containing protein [Dokdonia pacifica]|uniref:Outer membrane receptor proteins, mostly Fe transport n=1 Tax=Dokdonia pacifica TaxID=1627892 RepID=A0A239DAZ1_9FLAO|nr:TonB-dependent receptor [Dokdonia pacifica]SNS29566.1 Outer membrane receptor proteins, mostly Fe transport [Dokdonia pacifica]
MRIRILFILLMTTYVSYSQISGQVIDANNTPIPFANVILYNDLTKELTKGVITSETGAFYIDDIPDGHYTVQIHLISYQTWNSESFAFAKADTKTFPNIILLEEATALDEVAIVAKKKLIERTQEGSVINVQSSILTKGSSALQVLERSPGVILDQRNNSFSLNGKSGTTIMINGKTQRIPTSDLITLLQGMSADNIQKIELLINPSARYDADGNAGIINIVMTKNEALGTRGNATVSAGYGEGVKQTSSVSLNYGSEKTTLYGYYSFSYDDTYSTWNGLGSTNIPVFGGETFIDFTSETSQLNRNHNLTSGIEYQLNKASLFGASITYNQSNPSIQTDNRGLYNFPINPFLDARINLRANGQWKNYNTSAFYETKNDNHTFGITADYINYKNDTPNNVQSIYLDENGIPFQPEGEIYNNGNRGTNSTSIDVGVLKIDYSRPINEKLTLEGGIKGSLSKTTNNARIEIQEGDTFITDPRFVNINENTEQIGAVYGIANYTLSNSINAQLGVRYEYWNQEFDDASLDRSFGQLFPSVFLTKTLSDTKSWNLAYNRRITRPSYNDLASFLSYNSPTSVFSGNPQLSPAITNSLTITYAYKAYSFSVIATQEDNPLARFQVTEDDRSDLAIIAPQNLKYQNSIDFQSNIPVKINNWWQLNLNGTIGVRQFKLLHTREQLTHDYVHYNFNGSQTIQFPSKISLEISGWYTSKHFNGSATVQGFGTVNAGLKKEFKNGSSLQLSVTDIFKSIDIKSQVGDLTREAYDNVFDVRFLPESAVSSIWRLSFSYPFGNTKVKEGNSRSSADSEKARIQN